MEMRKTIAKHPIVAVLAVVIVLTLAVYRLASHSAGVAKARWFYDIKTGQLYPYDGDELPPVVAPSGGEGVAAYVFGCGNCDQGARHLVYLEKFTDDGKRFFRNRPTDQPSAVNEGHLVASFVESADPEWVAAESPDGVEVRNAVAEVRRECSTRLVVCRP